MQNKTKTYRPKRYALLILVLVLLLGVALAFEKFGITNFHEVKPAEVNVTDDNAAINYGPPTEEEQRAGDRQKVEIAKDNENSGGTSPSSDRISTSVIITDAGQYEDVIEVRSFMPNHYQDGTCTVTITKDDYKVSKSTPAYRDVSTTICTNPLFARSEFAVSGDWQVIVKYTSDGAEGTSTPQTIRID